MELTIKLENPAKADLLYGPMDRNLKMIRDALAVQVFAREGQVKITGSAKGVSRAAAVLEALVQRGVERARLRSTGYGELCPINSGHNAAAWEANRRVEFHILADGQEPPSEGNLTCPANAQPH